MDEPDTVLPSFAGTDLMVTCAQVQQTAQQEQSNVVLLWIAKKYQKGRGRSSQLLLSLPDHDRVSLQLTNSTKQGTLAKYASSQMEDLGWGSYKVEILPGYLGLAASH